jgi:hypothetical protein
LRFTETEVEGHKKQLKISNAANSETETTLRQKQTALEQLQDAKKEALDLYDRKQQEVDHMRGTTISQTPS